MDNVLFVLQMWGMAVEAWNMQKIDNLIERVQDALEEEVSGISCEPQNWSEERVDHVIAATLPVVTTFLLALQELYAMKEEILVAEQVALGSGGTKVFENVKQMLEDYGVWVGLCITDMQVVDSPPLRPEVYLQTSLEVHEMSYELCKEFLDNFYKPSRVIQLLRIIGAGQPRETQWGSF